MTAYKFSDQILPGAVGYTYPDIWETGKTTGPDRLIIAPSGDQAGLMIELASVLPEPFGILYVLLVSRCGNAPGRYQSPYPIDRAEMEFFVNEFKAYFEQDGRHHIWITSVPADATIVYDNHNIVYAYGPLDEYIRLLDRRGLKEGTITIPAPHTHNYNPEFDSQEDKISAYWDWRQYPLSETDDL